MLPRLTYGSVCSGIEAATCAWHPLGWTPSFFSEIDKFPRAVLAHRYPSVPLHGDFTTIREGEYDPIDLLVGGTPCQSFSVAGLRGGMADARGNLALQYLALAARLRPRWLVWENVPGVLSSNGGRDFGSFLGGMVELGYGFAYRILDAQYFNLAQRRARVFVVGYLGDWRRAAAVLLERESLSGNPAPRREKGQGVAADIAPSLTNSGRGVERTGESRGQDPVVAYALNAHGGPHGRIDAESETFVTHSLRADGFDASEDGTGRGTPLIPFNITPSNSNKDFNAREAAYAQAVTAGGNRPSARGGDLIAGTLTGNGDAHSGFKDEIGLVPAVMTLAVRGRGDGHNLEYRDDGTANAVLTPNGGRAGIGVGAIQTAMSVRRLTPRECERLQGFPDDFTLIPYRGKPAADGPRYKALGNSMAVPCMAWIGARIAAVDSIARAA